MSNPTTIEWDPAFPQTLSAPNGTIDFQGLTKREYAAIAAMQGLLNDETNCSEYEYVAIHAVKHADALLAELAKEPGK